MMMTQTIGASGKASLLALLRQGMFFVPLVYILPRTVGLLGLQISQPISDVLSFSLSLLVTLPVLRQLGQGSVQEPCQEGGDLLSSGEDIR